LSQIIEANHNKDYSVVKTFKAGFTARFFIGFYYGDRETKAPQKQRTISFVFAVPL